MRPLTSDDIERISKWNAYEKPLTKVVTMNDYLGTITTRSCWNTSSMKLVENDNGDIFCLQSKGAFTLMGFDNEDWELASQVNNESALFKQAGNSIVVNVLESIFAELYK
jgi:hypothetical protein